MNLLKLLRHWWRNSNNMPVKLSPDVLKELEQEKEKCKLRERQERLLRLLNDELEVMRGGNG